jgi:tol-pal system protein YbgF
VLAALLLGAAALTPGCYTTQLGLLRTGLDSLRTQVDTLTVRDSIAYRVLADTRRELGQQRDLMLSTRASSGSTMQEMFDQMSRLEGKLDDAMHRFSDWALRVGASSAPAVTAPAGTSPGPGPGTPATGSPATSAPATNPAGPGPAPPPTSPPAAVNPAPSGPAPAQLYDQATRDLTEGRYALALKGYREFLARYPSAELADHAQYGVGECFFAQAAFDSAAVEYARVGARWPKGDRVPPALYRLGLCQQRLGHEDEARKTFEELVRRFPSSGEAGLVRDRLGASHR